MSYNVTLSDNFRKEAKRLTKKYRSLKTELEVLGEELSENPTLGTPLGNDVYKIHLAIKSKGEKDTISDEEIQQLLEGYT